MAPLIRTARRVSRSVNKGKHERLVLLVNAYAEEKDRWLVYLHSNVEKTKRFREIRDSFVKNRYKPTNGLPPSHWKNALEDACKQMDMFWKATFVDVRRLVNANDNLSDVQKRWCYSLKLPMSKARGFF